MDEQLGSTGLLSSAPSYFASTLVSTADTPVSPRTKAKAVNNAHLPAVRDYPTVPLKEELIGPEGQRGPGLPPLTGVLPKLASTRGSPVRNAGSVNEKATMSKLGFMGFEFPNPKEVTRTITYGTSRPTQLLLTDAKWLYDRALYIQSVLFGENADHPTTATILYGKSELMRLRRSSDKARTYLMSALAMRRSVLRSDHPQIAQILLAIGENHRTTLCYSKAHSLYEKALEILKNTYGFGMNHPNLAEALSNIGKHTDMRVYVIVDRISVHV